jgi:hypothetical protein
MSVFAKLGTAEVKGRSPFFAPDAQMRVEIQDISFFDSNNPNSNTLHSFKIKGEILESTTDFHGIIVSEDGQRRDMYSGKVGTKACQLVAFTPKSMSAARGNVKQFLTALFAQMTMDIRDSTPLDREDFTDDGGEFNEEGWIEATDEHIATMAGEDEEFAEFWGKLTTDPDSEKFGEEHAALAYETTVFEGVVLHLSTNMGGNGFLYSEWSVDRPL